MKSSTVEASNNNGRNHMMITKTPRWPSSRRTHSVSSTSSLSDNSSSSLKSFSPPPSPSTRGEQGIPFSWETIPGIPKNHILKKIDSFRRNHNHSHRHLPPPPAATTLFSSTTSKSAAANDPFIAALVECSKGGIDGCRRRGRWSLSQKLGFVNNIMSCKNCSAVTESRVFLAGGTRRFAYDVLKKRAG